VLAFLLTFTALNLPRSDMGGTGKRPKHSVTLNYSPLIDLFLRKNDCLTEFEGVAVRLERVCLTNKFGQVRRESHACAFCAYDYSVAFERKFVLLPRSLLS
jgi:hypothetical protein